MLISFVVPIYNEEKRIQIAIREIIAFRKDVPYENEWIFVDDGCTDSTEELARKEIAGVVLYRWIRLGSNQGKGRAVQRGVLEAKGDYIFFTDVDLSVPLREFESLLRPLKDGYDMAIGSRGLPDSHVVVHQNWFRETMGKIFNRFARLLTFRDVRDSQCGFKAFRKDVAERLFRIQKIGGFSFDAEIIYLAQRLSLRVAEIPVTWVNSKDSKVRIIHDSIRMLLDLFRIRWLHRNAEIEDKKDREEIWKAHST